MDDIDDEKEKYQLDLRSAKARLDDYIIMNLDLSKDNVLKDEAILKKKSELRLLHESHHAILLEKMTQRSLIEESVLFKIKVLKQEIEKVDLELKRLTDMEIENEFLRNNILMLDEDIKKQKFDNDIVVNGIKSEMKSVTDNMSLTYVDELDKVRSILQKEAFTKGLTDAERRIILFNSKIKDEVGFQLVGMSNLSDRLERQDVEIQRMHEQLKNNQSKDIATHKHLGTLRLTRQRRKDEVAALQCQKDDLINQLTKLKEKLAENSKGASAVSMRDMKYQFDKLLKKIEDEKKEYSMWCLRYDKLLEATSQLYSQLRQEDKQLNNSFELLRSQSEETSHLQIQSLDDNGQQVQEPNNRGILKSAENNDLTKQQLIEIIANDKDLSMLFKSFRDKEDLVFTSSSSGGRRKHQTELKPDSDSVDRKFNVALWGTKTVVQIWSGLELSNK